MTLDVETIVAVSLMMAVFAAVAAVGTSIVLGAGFERLRAGFDVVSKQTGFFSDAIHKLEGKVENVDKQTQNFSQSMESLESKVSNVGEQANLFSESMLGMSQKIDKVDRQTGFFSDAMHKLERRIDTASEHEDIVAEKLKQNADTDLISAGKAEALVSHAEDLLLQVSSLASDMKTAHQDNAPMETLQNSSLHLSENIGYFSYQGHGVEAEEISYH